MNLLYTIKKSSVNKTLSPALLNNNNKNALSPANNSTIYENLIFHTRTVCLKWTKIYYYL
jgi:hypothetical protein